MDKELDMRIVEALKAYMASGVENQVDYQKFYLYSIVTHSTAIEGSTVTEIENQLLFDEGIAAKGRSLTEQMMNVDLKDAYLHAFRIVSSSPIYTPHMLRQLSALVMRRTGSEYSTIAGQFDSSKGDFRLCNVSAGIVGRGYLAFNKVPNAVEDFCCWLNNEIAKVDRTDVAACYRLSFEAHFRLVTIHPWVDGNGRTTRLVMNMIQWQLGLVPSIVRREDKGEYIQSLVDSRENEDSTIAQDMMLHHHIANLNRRTLQYQEPLNLRSSTAQVPTKYRPSTDQVKIIMKTMNDEYQSATEIMEGIGIKHRPTFRKNYLNPAIADGTLERLYPDKPKHPKQKYRLTAEAREWKSNKQN